MNIHSMKLNTQTAKHVSVEDVSLHGRVTDGTKLEPEKQRSLIICGMDYLYCCDLVCPWYLLRVFQIHHYKAPPFTFFQLFAKAAATDVCTSVQMSERSLAL